MKKILLLIIIVISLPFIYDKLLPGSIALKKTLPFSIKTSPKNKITDSINFNENTYSYSFFSPSPTQQLIYNLNLSDKFTSLDIIKDQGCTYLINGGFYDKLDQPIGLVIKDGLEVSPSQKNSLFNGFLSATSSGVFHVSTKKPSLKSEVAIQTGPMLMSDSTPHNLSLVADEYERRMVLAISQEKTPYFIVITLRDSEMEGPMLEDLPELVSKIGENQEIYFSSAINLDGGSASTFYSPDIHIKEMSTIGSYLCFR